MKLISLLSVLILITSCEQPDKSGTPDEVNDFTLPDSFSYKGRKPVWGNIEHVQLIQDWNLKRSSLDAKVGELIADTLTLHLEDGNEYILSRDSAVAYFENKYRGYMHQTLMMNAAIPVYYSDIHHYWVYSWINSTIELKNKESYTVYFHEDFRIVNNKIREIYQFRREPVIK